MPIFSGSRYEGIDSVVITDTDGKNKKFLLNREPVDITEERDFVVRKFEESEELDLISSEIYQDSRLYWIIAEANEIPFVFSIDKGREMLIPTLNVLNE